jgi:murein DD-endopeptidase MepM/ murein hydrolase activator NlpD
MQNFPLSDLASYSYADAWTDAHRGTDIFASRGQPVIAVADGTVRATVDPKGGKVVYLAADDGWGYYYAHLDAWAPGIEQDATPMPVYAGAFLGQVGTSGNAEGTEPHLHFQATAPNGTAVDPFDLLRAVDTHDVALTPTATKRRSRGGALAVLGIALGVAVIATIGRLAKSRSA